MGKKWYERKWFKIMFTVISTVAMVAAIVVSCGAATAALPFIGGAIGGALGAAASSSAFIAGSVALGTVTAGISIAKGASQIHSNPRGAIGYLDLAMGLFSLGGLGGIARAAETAALNAQKVIANSAIRVAREQALKNALNTVGRIAQQVGPGPLSLGVNVCKSLSNMSYIVKSYGQKCFEANMKTMSKLKPKNSKFLSKDYDNPLYAHPSKGGDLIESSDEVAHSALKQLLRRASSRGESMLQSVQVTNSRTREIFDLVQKSSSVLSTGSYLSKEFVHAEPLREKYGLTLNNFTALKRDPTQERFTATTNIIPQSEPEECISSKATDWATVNQENYNTFQRGFDSDSMTTFALSGNLMRTNEGLSDFPDNISIANKFSTQSSVYKLNPEVDYHVVDTFYAQKVIQQSYVNLTMTSSEVFINLGPKTNIFNGNYNVNMPVYMRRKKFGLRTNHIHKKFN